MLIQSEDAGSEVFRPGTSLRSGIITLSSQESHRNSKFLAVGLVGAFVSVISAFVR